MKTYVITILPSSKLVWLSVLPGKELKNRYKGFSGGKEPPANAGDARDSGLIPGSGKFPGVGNGNPLQYSCLRNPMDRRLVGYSPQVYRESDTTEYTKKCINRYILISYKGTSLIAQLVKNLPAIWFDFWVRKIHWRRDRLPIPVYLGFPCGSAGKESAFNEGDLGLIAGLGRSPEEGKGYPLQYSGLENSMDCIVHGVTKSRSQLSDFHFLLVIYKWLLDFKKFKPMCLNLLKKRNMIRAIEWVLDSVLEHQHFITLSCSLVWNTWKII